MSEFNQTTLKFNKTLDKHKVGLRVGEKTLIESIFPNFVDGTLNKGFDVTKSSYPFFEAQYNYLNNFSTKAFGTVLLSENENIKPLVDSIMSSLNLSTNMGDRKRSKYRNKIINTLINRHIIDNMPFFNGGYGIDNGSQDYSILNENQPMGFNGTVNYITFYSPDPDAFESRISGTTADFWEFRTCSVAWDLGSPFFNCSGTFQVDGVKNGASFLVSKSLKMLPKPPSMGQMLSAISNRGRMLLHRLKPRLSLRKRCWSSPPLVASSLIVITHRRCTILRLIRSTKYFQISVSTRQLPPGN